MNYTGNASTCEQLCQNTSKCMAWTFCGEGSVGPGPRCCLRSAVPAHVAPQEHMACGIARRAKDSIPSGAMDFDIGGTKVGYDPSTASVFLGSKHSPLDLGVDEKLYLHIFID